jgi:hypothetical protein
MGIGLKQRYLHRGTIVLLLTLCALFAMGLQEFADTAFAGPQAQPSLAPQAVEGQQDVSAIDERLRTERETRTRDFVITPHRKAGTRIYRFLLDRGRFVLSLKPWYRFKESAATDDNPDINRYFAPARFRCFMSGRSMLPQRCSGAISDPTTSTARSSWKGVSRLPGSSRAMPSLLRVRRKPDRL